LKQPPSSKAKRPSALSYASILPVLRKLAQAADLSLSIHPDKLLYAVTLGDCRTVKRWLTAQEKKK